MKLTVGIPAYKAYSEAWFTVQALRNSPEWTSDTELLIVDNFGDPALDYFAKRIGARYVKLTEKNGPAQAKNAVMRESRGEWTLCMDSHVLLRPGGLTALRRYMAARPESVDLVHGPLLMDDMVTTVDAMNPEWGGDKKFGTWRYRQVDPRSAPYEIPMHGCGLFACRTAVWPGFPDAWSGFANEEGYIHERFRRFGGRIILLPALQWVHLFRTELAPAPYKPQTEDLKRNFFIAYRDLKWDPAPVIARYGPEGAPS